MASTARGTNTTPGIYTSITEVKSSSNKSVGSTTLGLVGETVIGPAFEPISISTWKEFQTYFGGTNPTKFENGYPKYELGYIAKSYLQESQQLYVTRVLGLSGYKHLGSYVLTVENATGTKKNIIAVLRPKCYYDSEGGTLVTDVTGITGITPTISSVTNITDTTFTITVGINGGNDETYTFDLNPVSQKYITKVFGTSNNTKNSKLYVENVYYSNLLEEEYLTGSTANFENGTVFDIKTVNTDAMNDYSDMFRSAETPWFLSEVKGDKVVELFRFKTISDGDYSNTLVKVSIKNINPKTLKFDVIVRDYYDTDLSPVILEQFTNCTLDETDGTYYLGAKIGTVDEQYALKSKYIIVEINDDVRVKDSIPMGFEGYPTHVYGDYTTDILYNNTYEDDGRSSTKKYYFGISGKNYIDSDLFKYKGVETTTGTTVTNGFHLQEAIKDITGTTYHYENYTTVDSKTYSTYLEDNKTLRKFTAYFASGFDGWDIFRTNRTNTDYYQYNNYIKETVQTIDTISNTDLISNGIPEVPSTNLNKSDFYAYWAGIRSFADPEFTDINIFATPGIDWENNLILVSEAISMIEDERKDSIYVITTPDKPSGSDYSHTKSDMISANDTVDNLDGTGIDTSYATTYYPWVQYFDTDNNVYLYMPVTRDVVKSMAYTDASTYPWFAPAGLTRGNVNCIKAKKSLLVGEQNTLYSGRINPIVTYANDGVKIWGQKTLLDDDDSQLNRVNTMRLMLYLRKSVRVSNLPLIFEPNDNTTKNKFYEIVNPILNTVKTNRGISNFYIEFDDSTEAKERHELNVKIWIKPIGALEYINIDFMITPEGFDFSTLTSA